MAIRLVVTITATPGKGSELAQGYRTRCAEAMKEPGCEQFEVFQSVGNSDKAGAAGTLDRSGRPGRPCAIERDSASAPAGAARGEW